jgi:hypothetical protein
MGVCGVCVMGWGVYNMPEMWHVLVLSHTWLCWHHFALLHGQSVAVLWCIERQLPVAVGVS